LKFAEADFRRAKRMFDEGDTDGALIQLQQASETYLKAKLIEKGWKLRKGHDLMSLLSAAEQHGIAVPLSEVSASILSIEYLAGRYPMDPPDPEPTPEQAKACFDEVRKMLEPVDANAICQTDAGLP